MSDKNDRSDFTKNDDERFSPDIVFRKRKTNAEDNIDNGGDVPKKEVKEKSKARLWLENFLYHYKWHSIIALFLVVVILFCALQTCNKTTFDAYVLYAGGKNLRTFDDDAGEAVYKPVYDTLGTYVNDFDGDGNRYISFLDIYLPSDSEIAAEEDDGNTINPALLKENADNFSQQVLYGDYYICIISEHLFTEWTKNEKNNPFMKIKPYLPENAVIADGKDDIGYRLASEYGVYLSSTPLAEKSGFKYLPEDTVICFRILSQFTGGKKRAKERYANAETTLRKMLSDEAFS